MSGPDSEIGRPTQEQLGPNPGDYRVTSLSQGWIGPSLWVVDSIVERRVAGGATVREHVLYSTAGGLQREPLGPQPIDSSVGHGA